MKTTPLIYPNWTDVSTARERATRWPGRHAALVQALKTVCKLLIYKHFLVCLLGTFLESAIYSRAEIFQTFGDGGNPSKFATTTKD